MPDWKIKVLLFGYTRGDKGILTANVDVGMALTVPFWGVLLSGGGRHILLDTGANDASFVNGKMWGGMEGRSGETFVRQALQQAGVQSEDIDLVIYSHLHLDHAGNCHLFPKATHIFQQDEWAELLDPLPMTRVKGDYNQAVIPLFQRLNCCRIEGDLELTGGIRIHKTPGHTTGSQIVEVATSGGNYILAGDTVNLFQTLYPEMDELVTFEGNRLAITPASEYGIALPSAVTYNVYQWYQSIYRIKALLKGPNYLLPGHEPSLSGKTFPPE